MTYRFTDHGDGTVTDNKTGLMWTKNGNMPGKPLQWKEAMNYCSRISFCGYSDWRLPSKKEWKNIIDKGQESPALPSGHPFINVQLRIYWSSNVFAYITASVWIVHLRNGNIDASPRGNNSWYVWPVRTALD